MTSITLELLRKWRPWYFRKARGEEKRNWLKLYIKRQLGPRYAPLPRVMSDHCIPPPREQVFILWGDWVQQPLDLGPLGDMGSGSEARDRKYGHKLNPQVNSETPDHLFPISTSKYLSVYIPFFPHWEELGNPVFLLVKLNDLRYGKDKTVEIVNRPVFARGWRGLREHSVFRAVTLFCMMLWR